MLYRVGERSVICIGFIRKLLGCKKSHRKARWTFSAYQYQGVIVSTRTKTFAKKPTLVKLFWELTSTPVRCYNKSPLFFSPKSVRLNSVLCCGTTGKWVFFRKHRDVSLLACIDHLNIYYRLVIACIIKTDRSFMFVSHFGKSVTIFKFLLFALSFLSVYATTNQSI